MNTSDDDEMNTSEGDENDDEKNTSNDDNKDSNKNKVPRDKKNKVARNKSNTLCNDLADLSIKSPSIDKPIEKPVAKLPRPESGESTSSNLAFAIPPVVADKIKRTPQITASKRPPRPISARYVPSDSDDDDFVFTPKQSTKKAIANVGELLRI